MILLAKSRLNTEPSICIASFPALQGNALGSRNRSTGQRSYLTSTRATNDQTVGPALRTGNAAAPWRQRAHLMPMGSLKCSKGILEAIAWRDEGDGVSPVVGKAQADRALFGPARARQAVFVRFSPTRAERPACERVRPGSLPLRKVSRRSLSWAAERLPSALLYAEQTTPSGSFSKRLKSREIDGLRGDAAFERTDSSRLGARHERSPRQLRVSGMRYA